jgi:tetratricopeptide (TPR) repeat protein
MSHRLLKVFSTTPEQQVRAGALLLDHGREGLAEEHFAAALAASTDGKIPLSIADVCSEREHYDQADRYARLALERDGESAAAHAIMAESLLMRDELAEAERHIKMALSQAKRDADPGLLDELREMAQGLKWAKTLRLFDPTRSSR